MQPLNSKYSIDNMNSVVNIVKMIKSGDPEQIAKNMIQQNPRFKEFIEANKGKTPEQVAEENGINLKQIIEKFR